MDPPPSNPLYPSYSNVNPHNNDGQSGSSSTGLLSGSFNLPPDVPALTFNNTFQKTEAQPSAIPHSHLGSNQHPYTALTGATSLSTSRAHPYSFSYGASPGYTQAQSFLSNTPSSTAGMSYAASGTTPTPSSDSNNGQTHSSSALRYSGPSTAMSPTLSSALSEPASDSMITISNDIPDYRPHETPPATDAFIERGVSSQRNKQYTLPDGSVVSGKGLGRGRPGVKRGPRGSNSQTGEDSAAGPSTPLNHSLTPNKKRKSDDSDNSIIKARASTSDSLTTGSRDSSEEYNPSATQTRSGRVTQKPISLVNGVTASASPSGKSSRAESHPNAASSTPTSTKSHPKIKRRLYRGREQFALCEHCLRGHGPPGNVIVFCDACNKCWHQRCHDPQVSKQTVSDSKAEWFCAECDRILHGKKKKGKQPAVKVEHHPPPSAAPVAQTPVYAGPRVGGRFVQPEHRLAYLKTLSKDDLVSLVLHASDLAPDLPLFQTLAPPPPAPMAAPRAQFTSTYVTPNTQPPPIPGNAETGDDDAVDEGYDGYFDETAALYPKPGMGVRLPPEREDVHMLLEGKESKTFSHWIRGMAGNAFSGTGNISALRP